MKCEICHEHEAEVAIHRVVDGADRELYVCQACAQAGEIASPPPGSKAEGRQKGTPDAAKLLTGLIKQMIDAGIETASIIANPTSREPAPPCPFCGMTAEDYRRSSRLGCAHCYDHFASPLGPVIRDMQPGATHVGKVPADFPKNAREEAK